LRTEFRRRHLWARGYFVCTSGNVTDEVIAEYIRTQGAEPQDAAAFKITE
jgi:putative transposase